MFLVSLAWKVVVLLEFTEETEEAIANITVKLGEENDICENFTKYFRKIEVVTSSVREPVVGWVDNFNGPAGLNVLGVKGLSKVMLGDSDVLQDYLFVDNLVKFMAIAAWRKTVEPDPCRTEIYNVTDYKMPISHLIGMGNQLALENPPDSYLMTVRNFILLKNPTVFYLLTLIFHILPAIIFDGAALISGNDPRLMKIYRKAYIANLSLIKFMCCTFSIKSEKYETINGLLMESDEPAFEIFFGGKSSYSKEAYLIAMKVWSGIKKYLLKESAIASKGDIRKYSRLKNISNIVVYVFQGVICFSIIWKLVFPWFTSTINNIVAV